jgi:predicted metal-dependent phosphotriesterase family hydrolase
VIRTILRDYAPRELGDGATPFHEHMSFAPDFLARFRQYAAEAQAINRPPNTPTPAAPTGDPDLSWMKDLDLMSDELAIAKHEGIACIVDAGHPDMGRDIGVLGKVRLAHRGKWRLLCAAFLLA